LGELWLSKGRIFLGILCSCDVTLVKAIAKTPTNSNSYNYSHAEPLYAEPYIGPYIEPYAEPYAELYVETYVELSYVEL
jgi:hypothetical protein